MLRFRIARLLSASGRSALRDASGTLTLDHQRLTVEPLRIGLRQGAVTGRMVVEQRGGAPKPTVTLDLRDERRRGEYQPVGKDWRTLRRGDTVRGPDGYEFTVRKVTLREADPPLAKPIEIESVAAWTATGLRR